MTKNNSVVLVEILVDMIMLQIDGDLMASASQECQYDKFCFARLQAFSVAILIGTCIISFDEKSARAVLTVSYNIIMLTRLDNEYNSVPLFVSGRIGYTSFFYFCSI